MRPSLLSFVIPAALLVFLAAWPLQASAAGSTTGKVVETMNAGGYTYVLVDDGAKKTWAAAPQFAVAVGNTVVVPDGIAMTDFHSKTLDRTFDVVYFVDSIDVEGAAGGKQGAAPAHGTSGQGVMAANPGHANIPPGMPGHGMGGHAPDAKLAAAVDLSNIKKADGGQTVAELFAKKAGLTGKDVAVRGRVVKYTAEVMGKNWMHVRDGTGSEGSNDLTVSTSATAAVGDTVVVRGKLGADKDLGAGYHYDIIVEDASIAVE